MRRMIGAPGAMARRGPGATIAAGADGSRWTPRSSKPVASRAAWRGGFDSHALPPGRGRRGRRGEGAGDGCASDLAGGSPAGRARRRPRAAGGVLGVVFAAALLGWALLARPRA